MFVRTRWFPSVLAVLAFAASASARDVVIHPLIDPPLASLEALVMTPTIDRFAARELGRLRFDPMPRRSEKGLVNDGEVQMLVVPLPLRARDGDSETDLPLAATARIELEGAGASRIRFTGVPAGTVLWLAGSEDQEFVRYEPASEDSWGPTTQGATVYVAAQGPLGHAAIAAVASVSSVTSNSSACMEDVACPTASTTFDSVMNASRAIAYIRFVRGGESYVCTGALVSDAAGSRTPYLLTARHCIDTMETAATVEIIWDLRSSACGSNQMAPYSRSNGAELLVASEKTDVALLKLKSKPAGRVFLGIDTRLLEPGTSVNRVSHASGLSQTFAAGVVDGSAQTCSAAPRPSFVYSRATVGGISGGSSGAPLLVHGLYVAGQLLGLCGSDPSNDCATFNRMVDGTIRESWPLLAPYLDPALPKPRRRSVR